jgi:hypothetical protein
MHILLKDLVLEYIKESKESITPNDIHKLADSKGIKWDNEPSFLKLTKKLTGKEHLDDLDIEGLHKVKNYLEKQKVAEARKRKKNSQASRSTLGGYYGGLGWGWSTNSGEDGGGDGGGGDGGGD